MKKRRVVLFGKSIILGTIGASLSLYPDLEIIPLSPPLPDFQVLKDLAPHVILYDIEATLPDAVLALLETSPDLLLIGINPDSNQVMVWSGRQLHELSTHDLVQVINSGEEGSPTSSRAGHE
jgi:hypothetical protein